MLPRQGSPTISQMQFWDGITALYLVTSLEKNIGIVLCGIFYCDLTILWENYKEKNTAAILIKI